MIGPFLTRNASGPPSLRYDNREIPLDHNTAELWWWVLSEYMKHWAEEKRREQRN